MLRNKEKFIERSNEYWKTIDYDNRYQVSNYGNFRKQIKNGYRYLKSFRKGNHFIIKIRDKEFTCARLVANYFIKHLESNDRVYHINKIESDNYYKNLKIVNLVELGKLTGHISKSKRVVEIKNNEIERAWSSARKCALELFVSYQTVMDYCNKKVKYPMFHLMWEDDYFNQEL